MLTPTTIIFGAILIAVPALVTPFSASLVATNQIHLPCPASTVLRRSKCRDANAYPGKQRVNVCDHLDLWTKTPSAYSVFCKNAKSESVIYVSITVDGLVGGLSAGTMRPRPEQSSGWVIEHGLAPPTLRPSNIR